MQCASSKQRWDALSQVSIQCRMCVHQMIPKRCCAVCARAAHHKRCHLQCPRCNSSALYSLQHQQGQSGSRRQRRGRDGPPVCAAHGPLHARRESATHGRDAKRTSSRGRGRIQCCIALSTCESRHAAAASSSANSTWSSSSGKDMSAIKPYLASPRSDDEAL